MSKDIAAFLLVAMFYIGMYIACDIIGYML